MAVLSTQDRQDCAADYMRQCKADGHIFTGILKADVQAMINYLDDYLNTNAAAINSGSPATFRNNATQPMKALAMTAVIAKRYIKGA